MKECDSLTVGSAPYERASLTRESTLSRSEEIFVHLTGMVCPWVGNLTAKF